MTCEVGLGGLSRAREVEVAGVREVRIIGAGADMLEERGEDALCCCSAGLAMLESGEFGGGVGEDG